MIKEVISYQTSDGKMFPDKKEAEIHEKLVNSEIAYRVDYGYELRSYGFIYIKSKPSHSYNVNTLDHLAEDWCHKNLGNRIIWASDLPVQSWNFTKLSTTPDKKLLENFIMAEL